MTFTWGAIEPAESVQTRLRLDFGLRPAILALNDWAVPGLGGVFFVRQLTWSCLGLMLAEEMDDPPTAARIAEGIEALASWMALKRRGHEKDDRVLGKRKMRNQESLSFDEASSRGAYVTIPFRSAATGALPGLGFCHFGPSRFNALELAPPGWALAHAALRDAAVTVRLKNWIAGTAESIRTSSESFKQALLPGEETDEERELVWKQLQADRGRKRIMELVQPMDAQLSPLRSEAGIAAFLQGIDDPLHRARLDACFVFERVRASALQAAQALADCILHTPQPWSALAAAAGVQPAFDTLVQDCKALATRLDKLQDLPPEIRGFCDEQLSGASLEPRMRALATRLPQVFSVGAHALGPAMGFTSTLVAGEAIETAEEEAQSGGLPVPRPLLRLKRLHREIHGGTSNDA